MEARLRPKPLAQHTKHELMDALSRVDKEAMTGERGDGFTVSELASILQRLDMEPTIGCACGPCVGIRGL